MSDQQQPVNPQYPPYYMQRKKSRWWVPIVVIAGILLVFVGFIAAILGSVGSMFKFEKETVTVKENSVLYLTLDNVPEFSEESPFNFMGGGSGTSFYDIVRAIKIAKNDNKIKGIYYNAKISNMGFPQAIEIQEAIDDFKKSGKFFYAFIETGRENEYFNALPADKIFMPSEGIMEMNGFGIASIFMKGFLDKLGIEFFVQGFEDFKSAAESLNKEKFSDSSRYQLQVLLAQRYKVFTEAVTKYRKMDPAKLNAILSNGIYTADSIKAAGFIDEFMTEAQVREMMKDMLYKGEKDKDKKKLRLVSVGDYLSSDLPDQGKPEKDKAIAIVYAEGPIQDAPAEGFNSEKVISTAEFVKNLKKAREDKEVKAVIIRVNSPGGSVIASDAINEEILKIKAVKPVYSSMGNVAASGGYYISMSCDTIIAHPTTITGSIGVIMAIPNLSGLMGKLGMTSDTISTGPAANFMNGLMPMQERDKKVLHDLGQGIYFRFVDKVAKNRKMTFDETRALAKGRVWTGEDAYKNGLVDVLGGFEDALKIAKKRIGVPENKKVKLKIYPEPEDGLNQILKMFGLSPSDGEDEDDARMSGIAKSLNIDKAILRSSMEALPPDARAHFDYMLQLYAISMQEKTMVALPWALNIR